MLRTVVLISESANYCGQFDGVKKYSTSDCEVYGDLAMRKKKRMKSEIMT